MKNPVVWALLILGLFMAAFLVLILKPLTPSQLAARKIQEDQSRREDCILRWHREAAKDMISQITNDQIGLRKVIKISLDDRGDEPTNWTGCVQVEFLNIRGGIERTNLYYQFSADPDLNPRWERTLHASLDWQKMYQSRQDALSQ